MAELDKGTPSRRVAAPGLRAMLLGGTVVAALVGAGALPAAVGPALAQGTQPANAGLGNLKVEEGYADLAAAVMPAVVNVRVERSAAGEAQAQGPMDDPEMRRFFERFFGTPPEGPGRPGQGPQGPGQGPSPRRQMGEGSGFVVSPDGLIVTNAHVAGGADKIEVTFKDGRKLTATLKGVDEKTDLALLKVDGGSAPLPYVVFGDSSKVRPGDKVIAVGNPFGLGGTVTAGIVSATGREIGSGPYDDYIQVDAPINRGNSGGPTFNLRGEVVGVNTAIFSPSGGSVGIGFAIAANLAKSVVDDLRDDGTVERGYLGVGIQGVDEDLARALKLDRPRGALVSRVESGSPAEKAGVRRGDVVLDFNGTPIDRVGQLSRAVAAVDAGAGGKLTVWRDGREQTLSVQVGEMPTRQEVAAVSPGEQDAAQPRLGLGLAAITPEARERLNLEGEIEGVLVTQVTPESPADEKGIEPGDVIVSVNQQPVREPRQLIEAVRKAGTAGDKQVLLLIVRDGQQRFEAVPLATS
jgi:serine protease Do